jgi:Skp family chaperone for outer membrane proteins
MAETRKEMTESELAGLIDTEFSKAQGRPGGDIASERTEAWLRYTQRPYGDEVEGESAVVTSDVSDVVDGIMPSLLRLFATADNLVDFTAFGPDDEKQAAQETDYVHHIFFQENPAFLILYVWFFDALVQKNGYVKAYADDEQNITQESYEGLSQEDLSELMEDDDLEPVSQTEREMEVPGPDGVTPVKQTVYDIVFRRVETYKCIRVVNVRPDEMRISSECHSLDLNQARFVGQERDVTRDELLAMGFKKEDVEALATDGDSNTGSTEKTARYDRSDEQNTAPATIDKSQQPIRLREGFLRVDFDGDGRSELRHVIKANSKILQNEIADRQPYHPISPKPLPHKHFGQSVADKVMDVQRVTTTLTRQTLTNLYHVNRPGHAVWEAGIGENTIDDLLTTRIGRIARFSRPVAEAYTPMSVPFTAQASFPMLEFYDKAKRDRTGISSDSQGLDANALKNIQTTVLAQASDIGRMKIEAIARIFGETGIASLFQHIHELAQKHQTKEDVVKLRGQWVQVNPSEWRTRRKMTISIGMGVGTREQNLVHLDAIWAKIKDIALAGGMGTIVTPMNVYNAAAEYSKNAGYKNAALFFTPTDKMPAQTSGDQDQQTALAQRQQQLDARQQELDAAKHQLDAAKVQLSAQEQTLKAQEAQFAMRQQAGELQLKAKDLERKRKKDVADVMLAVEGLKNQLTELGLRYSDKRVASAAAAAPQPETPQV